MVEKGKNLWRSASKYIILTIWLLLNSVLADDDHVYNLEFTDVAEDCPDFTNEVIIADLTLLALKEHATLSGSLQVTQELGASCELFIDVGKKLDNGREDPVMSVVTDICEAIQDKDAPWYAIFDAAGITECPIAMKTYTMDTLKISLDFAQGFLNHNWANKYNVKMTVNCGALEEKACFTVGIEITED